MKVITEFTIKLVKKRKIKDVIKASKYNEVNFLITEGIRKRRLSLQNEEIGEQTIVIVGSDESVSSNDVLSEARRLGLVRPSYGNAFLVGEQRPDEQITGPIVFLHDPQYSWSGHSFNLVLDVNRKGRIYQLRIFRWLVAQWVSFRFQKKAMTATAPPRQLSSRWRQSLPAFIFFKNNL
ncbi:MAG: hypothetical protein WCR84_03240 [Candidatus Paceibacterota bacterium]